MNAWPLRAGGPASSAPWQDAQFAIYSCRPASAWVAVNGPVVGAGACCAEPSITADATVIERPKSSWRPRADIEILREFRIQNSKAEWARPIVTEPRLCVKPAFA